MANFLRALGRAAPAINLTARTALGIAQDIREAPLQEAAFRSNEAISGERLKQMQFESAEMERQKQERTKPLNAKSVFHPIIGNLLPTKQEEWMKWAKSVGAIDENGNTSPEKIEHLQKTMLLSKDLTKKLQGDLREALSIQIEDIDKKIDSLREDPNHDRKKMDTLLMQRKQLLAQGSDQEVRWEKLSKMQEGYELYGALQKSSLLTPELKAMATTAMTTGKGIDEAMKALKEASEQSGKNELKEKFLDVQDRAVKLKEEAALKGVTPKGKPAPKPKEPPKKKELTPAQRLTEFNKYLNMHYSEFALPNTRGDQLYASLNPNQKKLYMKILAVGKHYLEQGIDPLEAFNKAQEDVYGKGGIPTTAPSQTLIFDPKTGAFIPK